MADKFAKKWMVKSEGQEFCSVVSAKAPTLLRKQSC